jgi:hypothetical protein
VREVSNRTQKYAPVAPSKNLAPLRRAAIALSLASLVIPFAAFAQSAAEWSQIKSNCNLPASTVYNDWVAQGCPCNKTGAAAATNSTATPAMPAGLTPEQQLGTQIGMMGANMIGQGLRQLLSGPTPAKVDPAQQQRNLAAQQLNNSGVYLFKQGNYSGAINLFQQALGNTPNDQVIAANLALAKQRLERSRKNAAAASQTSDAIAQLLNSAPQSLPSSPVNSAVPGLIAVDISPDTKVVDLRGTTRSSVNPAQLGGGASATGETQQQLQQNLDDQFDKAIGASETQSSSAAQGQAQKDLNDQFDKAMAASESQTETERNQSNAEFDKLYNDAAVKSAAAAAQQRAALQSKLASVNMRCAAAEAGSVLEASCKQEKSELLAALAKIQ